MLTSLKKFKILKDGTRVLMNYHFAICTVSRAIRISDT